MLPATHKTLPIIFLMGPTGSGKTELAVHLVQRFPLEIISVDSAQIYRGLDIGTAKPSPELLALATHHLINIRDPMESYSAAEFRTDALHNIASLHAETKIPLLVGGTNLYFRALRYGLSKLPNANPELRSKLEYQAAQQGWRAMHAKLAKIDPTAAARIHPNDSQRIQRALEVWHLTNITLSAHLQGPVMDACPYPILILGRVPKSRELLRARLATRFHSMLEQGLEQEIATLLADNCLSPSVPAARCVGYRQVIDYLNGNMDRNTMIEKAITATRGLAKRQMTWLRTELNINWLYDEDQEIFTSACKLVHAFLSNYQ
ncbi:hypothetical protein TI04_04690 [Achromatium sp. WMS2]|nr:hypothetical protein TI04_04690 [Achromatium sp. WMS2]